MPAGITPSSGTLKRLAAKLNSNYTKAVLAQAIVSGFHFVLNLLLLRMISPYDYGVFAYAFVLGMFAQAVNNALISTPLTVYTPVIKNNEERSRQEWMLGTANLFYFVALVLCGAIYTLASDLAYGTVAGVTAFVAVYSARHFSRSFGYARMRPLVTALGDIAYVIHGALLVSCTLWLQADAAVGSLLGALAVANLVAMALERGLLHGATAFRFAVSSLQGYHAIWAQSRWALAGALTTLFMGQAHSVIVTSWFGPQAFAPLAAGFVLFGPIRVALNTWQNMVKPEMAVDIANNKSREVNQRITSTALLMAAAVVIISIILYLVWPLIYNFLYARKYADQPMAFIVATWAIITLFAAIYNAPSAGLQAMRDFKILAIASIYGALIAAAGVVIALLVAEAEHTLFGVLMAELFTAAFLLRVMRNKLRALV